MWVWSCAVVAPAQGVDEEKVLLFLVTLANLNLGIVLLVLIFAC